MSQRPFLDLDDETSRILGRVTVLLAGVALIGTWGSVGLAVLFAEHSPSVRGVVSSLAFAVAGVGVGVLVGLGGAWYARRRGRAFSTPGLEDLVLAQVLMGLVAVGWGTEDVLQGVPTGWAALWALHFSGLGGLLLGIGIVAFVGGGGVRQRCGCAPSRGSVPSSRYQ